MSITTAHWIERLRCGQEVAKHSTRARSMETVLSKERGGGLRRCGAMRQEDQMYVLARRQRQRRSKWREEGRRRKKEEEEEEEGLFKANAVNEKDSEGEGEKGCNS